MYSRITSRTDFRCCLTDSIKIFTLRITADVVLKLSVIMQIILC